MSAKACPSRIATGVRFYAVGDVADGVNAGNGAARELVNCDATVFRNAHTCGLKPQPGDIRLSSRGEHDLIRHEGPAVRKLHTKAMLHPLNGINRLPGDDGYAAPLHLRAQMLAHVVIEPTQNIFAAVDEGHSRTQPMKDTGEFDRDIAPTLDKDMLRQHLEVKRLVGRDDMAQTGDVRTEMRRSPGRNQNMLGAYLFVVCGEAHGVRVLDHRPALHKPDIGTLKRADIGRLEARDFPVLVRDEPGPVENRLADRPPIAGRILELVAGSARRRRGASWERSRGSRMCRQPDTPPRSSLARHARPRPSPPVRRPNLPR